MTAQSIFSNNDFSTNFRSKPHERMGQKLILCGDHIFPSILIKHVVSTSPITVVWLYTRCLL